jgi:DNA-directed RNA polymerase specialized sigma24 family protein
MNDPHHAAADRLVAALRVQEPDALSALLDAYSDRLFRYCWFMLRNRDVALIALRDTVIVAQAHIGRLTDPAQFSSWLYSLAHVECRRRRPVLPGDADEPPARPSQPDADSRLMAWNAVTSIDPAEMEALDLASRHDVDLGLVLGLSAQETRALLDRSRQDLERALGAEILVSRGSHACPDRAEVMRGWAGMVTPELRDRVLLHAAGCPVCGPNLPRKVAAARVFALLPVPALPADARHRVLTFFGDPQMAAYREFAVTRAADFSESGFPFSAQRTAPVPAPAPAAALRAVPASRPGKPPQRAPRPAETSLLAAARTAMPRGRVLTAVAVTATAAAVAATLVLAGLGGAARNPSREPGAEAAGPSGPRHAGAGAEAAAPIATPTAIQPSPGGTATPGDQLFVKLTQPLPTTKASGPPVLPPRRGPQPIAQPTATSAAPPQQGSLDVSPGDLQLGTGSTGQLTISAEGAAESWYATTSSGQLELSAGAGTLPAGQSVTLTVTVDRAGTSGGTAILSVDAGTATEAVQVSWAPLSPGGGHTQPSSSPTPTRPAPSPSPSPSTSPSASPSPSPSNSSGSSPPPSQPPPSQPPTSQPPPSRTSRPTWPPRPTSSPSQRPTPEPPPSFPPPRH